VHKSIIVWKDGAKTCLLHFTATQPVTKLVLGATYDADVNKKNNVWVAK
jgi:hypothetical protein